MNCYDCSAVGYQNEGVQKKFSFVASSFTKVGGGEDFTLADFQVNCNEEDSVSTGWEELTDAIIELDGSGTFKRRIVYVPTWYADGEDYDKGWYDAKDGEFTNKLDNAVNMPFGYGYQICCSAITRKQEVKYSGEVKNAPTFIDLTSGFFTIANCRPTELKLDELIVNCNEEESVMTGWEELTDAVIELDENGTFARRIIYVPAWYADGEVYDKGWYDSSDGDFTTPLGQTVKFDPGTGFQVCISASRGQRITIKSALAKDAE